MAASPDEPHTDRPVPAVPPPRPAPDGPPDGVVARGGLPIGATDGDRERVRTLPDVPSEEELARTDRLIDEIRLGVRGTDDPDPLVRLLARLRRIARRRRAGARRLDRTCLGQPRRR